MKKEKITYVAVEDFMNDLLSFDEKYGHDNFFSVDMYEDGTLVLDCGYESGGDTVVSIYATTKRIVYAEHSEEENGAKAVTRTERNAELFDACYQMLYSGFSIEEGTEDGDENNIEE